MTPESAVLQSEARAFKAEVAASFGATPFRARWWLANRHLQTIWRPVVDRGSARVPTPEAWPTPDGDAVQVAHQVRDPSRPAVLLLHGLEGSLSSSYMGTLWSRFAAGGWNVIALQYRSCGGIMNRARRLYHTGETGDLDGLVSDIGRRWPGMPLGLVGVSLGGNLVGKWLGERGGRAPDAVFGGVAISPPFDVTVSGPQMDRLFGGAYVRHFLKTLIPKALEKEAQYPGSIDVARVRRARSFLEFDDLVTAPLHGFRDAHHYWASIGCGQFLDAVRRPLLLIAAADDPFNPEPTLPRTLAASSPWLHPLFTRRGGHVGFLSGRGPRLWAEARAEAFLQACARRAGVLVD